MSAARSALLLVSLVTLGTASAFAQEKPPLPGTTVPAAEWVASQGGAVPAGARPSGYESAGYLYICRANADGGVHPGKVRPGLDGCFVPLNGREVSIRQYEVLVGQERWDMARDGDISQAAVEAGRTRSGQPLYVCRSAGAAGQLVPGKTGAGIRGCSIGVGGVEQTQAFYQVLVR
jgi:hypothetical protein